MHIMIHVDGLDVPICSPIGEAGRIAKQLEDKGKTFRLGKLV